MQFAMAKKKDTLRGTNSLTFSHCWLIYNFVHLYDENCQWKWGVQSEEFSAPDNEELKFSLRILPKAKIPFRWGMYLEVALYAWKVPAMWEGKLTVKEVRSIEDEEGEELYSKVYPETNKVYDNSWINEDAFMSVDRLLDPWTGYLRKGTLKVLTEVTLFSQENSLNWPWSKSHTFSSTTIPSTVSSLSHRLIISHLKWLTEESTRQMPLKVESQYFALERKDIGKMKLEFYPKGVKGNDEEKVWIAIQNENKSSFLVHWEWSLINRKGDKCHQKEYTAQIPSLNGKTWSIPRRALLSLLSSLPKDELIIDCNVTVLVPENGENPFTPSCSFIDLALFTYHYVPFTWTIEGYFKQISTQEYVLSALFSPPTDPRFTFFLRVYPKMDSEYVIIELNLAANIQINECNECNECKVDWLCAIVNAKGEEWNAWAWSGLLEKDKGIGLFKLISHQRLDNYRRLLPDDKLTIKSQLWIHEPRKNLPPELSDLPSNDPAGDLARGVNNLIIGDNATFTNSILAAGTTLTARNITQNSVSKSAESEAKPK